MEWHSISDTHCLINEFIYHFKKNRYDNDEDGMILNEWYSLSHKWVYLPLQNSR